MQEKSELARGLCCLRGHFLKDIAQEIWASVPATVLVPLPSQQSEIQRLKAEHEMLATQLQSAKAMEKRYYESWVGTFPQFKSLKAEIEELKKTLEETQQVEGVSEDGNEFLTTKFATRRNRVLPIEVLPVEEAAEKLSRRCHLLLLGRKFVVCAVYWLSDLDKRCCLDPG